MEPEEEDKKLNGEETGEDTELPIPGEEGEEEQGEEEQEQEEAQPFKTFKTQEEHDEYIKQELAKHQQAPKPDEKKDEKKEFRVFEDGFQPKNWNDFALKLLESPAVVQRLQELLVPETAKAIEQMTTKQREDMDKINQGFDAEYDDLAKDKLVPPRNTEEGRKINLAISTVGATYGQTSIKAAFKLWKKIPVAQGGGLDYVAPAKQEMKNKKKKAALIGSPTNSASAGREKGRKYSDLHKKGIDDLVEEADE